MKTLYRLTLLGVLALSLASCVNSGGTASQTAGGGTGGGTGGNTTPVVSKSDKQKVIDYFESNGTLSDGAYLVGAKTSDTDDGYSFVYSVVESYTPSDDSFMLIGNTDVTKNSTTVSYMGAVGFNWGSFDSGTFLSDVEISSYKALFRLTNLTFASDAEVDSYTITLTKSSFPSSFSTSTLLNSGKTAVNSLNLAIRFYDKLGLPSLR